jgi:hypothetical protein
LVRRHALVSGSEEFPLDGAIRPFVNFHAGRKGPGWQNRGENMQIPTKPARPAAAMTVSSVP